MMQDLDLTPIEARVSAANSFFMPYEVQEAYQNLVEDGWMPCDANVMANSFTDEAALLAEVKRLRRERDAAIADLRKWKICGTCGNFQKRKCVLEKYCSPDGNWAGCKDWQWRGQHGKDGGANETCEG